MMKTKTTCAAVALTLGLGAAANAAIVGMTSIAFTGTATEDPFPDETRLIDNSGIAVTVDMTNITTAAVDHANPGASNAWVTNDPGAGGGDYFADGGGTVIFEIIFDGTYNVTDFYNWSYDFGGAQNNNIKDFTLEFGVGDFASSLGTVTVARPTPGAAPATVATVFTADRVRMTVTDNHFGDLSGGADGGDRVGAVEFRFTGTAVPEPSSTALLGLGGLALIMRRRK